MNNGHGSHKLKRKPRVAFLGLGWIGLSRLKALAASDLIDIVALSDEQPSAVKLAREFAPKAVSASFADLLSDSVEGLVIATPNAYHCEQTVAALRHGMSVFCQKPLGRTVAEALQATVAARESDRLLQVDLSYRFIPGMQQIRELAQAGELGNIFAVDLKFHNGYGPGKPWFYDHQLAGGGCLLDLGVHMLDLGLWSLDFPRVTKISSALFSKGTPLKKPADKIEDYATAQMQTEDGVTLNLACSWNLSIGADAAIEVWLHGSEGTAVLRNVQGSFFDFVAERFRGTERETLYSSGTDRNWGAFAAVDWCQRLAAGQKYQSDTETLLSSNALIDRIYAA
jgi:predicted dehydrogenase